MKTFAKSLSEMTAADLMKQPVQAIPQEISLASAACILRREKISGAPVIDGEGRCVGVLSTTDFLGVAAKDRKSGELPCPQEFGVSDWQMFDVDSLPPDEVRRHMSGDVVTVAGSTPIADVARMMLDAHIHRVFVVDGQRRPVGIVSSTDIIAAVAYADFPVPGVLRHAESEQES